MEDNTKSPIIDRLCKFIAFSGLTNSQFADKTGIPRPSLSQMLHGRNKSMNNQVLEKLNDTFPELNVLWLLFGQGDMLTVSNIEFSERQKQLNENLQTQQNIDLDEFDDTSSPTLPFTANEQSGAYQASAINTPQNTDPTSNKSTYIASDSAAQNDPSDVANIINRTIASKDICSKKIASIIVLYSDNSFETFMPSKE